MTVPREGTLFCCAFKEVRPVCKKNARKTSSDLVLTDSLEGSAAGYTSLVASIPFFNEN